MIDMNGRAAGILLHITSLPGSYGCGDLGYEARAFADFLVDAGQRVWQVLPLNPTEKETGYSPYSSYSSLAGNTLLISPERLRDEGWLDGGEVKRYQIKSSSNASFPEAEKIKASLFDRAYTNFASGNKRAKEKFTKFCYREREWLDDFALFVVLKQSQQGRSWTEWPDPLRNRNAAALKKASLQYHDALEKIKWLQYCFFTQWFELKAYCNERGIRLLGDLPFYVSHDSADVWANREIFSVDKKGKPVLVAGVPPDYFNADGQLWGMPVFRWDVLKKNRYAWWVRRFRKNIELFDVLRLDHFRAFADYWAVAASEKTARNGKWRTGPGAELFHAAARKLGHLPFVAEDLGDINDKVFALRDAFQFPGMKVLHFAFSDNLPVSDYIPHNYTPNFVVYTGTHDNNTTKGWYRKDIGRTEKRNLRQYFEGIELTENNIHRHLIRLAYASVAKLAIIPFQDIAGLDEASRFNAPATVGNNWLWRMNGRQMSSKSSKWLREQTTLFGRYEADSSAS